ncbi:pentatricopeptide repeat-containing protein At4g02750-like [Pistacia vera]|uniref:pentatricopeptide repeat-containing protein At4g02750-like n=1 Tax=Pistacia vera TaxID=55513 RepID=UPI0012635738|nr:pentatricopeptide repeat-containing protein At4g02750-like [Pistacia vera]
MIVGYAQSGLKRLFALFVIMKRDCERLIRFVFKSALNTCSNIAALELGKQLHGQLVKVGFEASWFVRKTLLVMYCNCESAEEAYHAFKEISNNDVVSRSMMIVSYARHGFGKDALLLFESMKTRSIKPDDKSLDTYGIKVTNVGILEGKSAYSRDGARDEKEEIKLPRRYSHADMLAFALQVAEEIDDEPRTVKKAMISKDSREGNLPCKKANLQAIVTLSTMKADMLPLQAVKEAIWLRGA